MNLTLMSAYATSATWPFTSALSTSTTGIDTVSLSAQGGNPQETVTTVSLYASGTTCQLLRMSQSTQTGHGFYRTANQTFIRRG
jgi:hypothetical protein